MNKTILIAGGASIASLAVGSVGGYLIAKKKFDETVGDMIAVEVRKTKKYYETRITELKETSATPGEIADQKAVYDQAVEKSDEEVVPKKALVETDPSTPADKRVRDRQSTAKKALIDYQGASAKPPLADLVQHHNIFADAPRDKSGKKTPPLRDETTGKFVPKHSVNKDSEVESDDDPSIVDEERFLVNEEDWAQESVVYYDKAKTAVLAGNYDHVIDNACIGEANLTLFPDEDPSVLYIRHPGLQIYYQVTRTFNSLIEDMGMGESDLDPEDSDDVEYADQD